MQLGKQIKKHIIDSGFLSLHDFMQQALYHHEFGYYISANPIGTTGDFTTSPEISQLFGEVLALYLISNIRQNFSDHEKLHLLEIGAGRGTLMADMLSVFQKFDDVYQKLEISIIDVNKNLIELQKTKLGNFNVSWFSSLQEFRSEKQTAPTIIYANEFFDCLPIEQFIYKNGEWHQRVLALDENEQFTISYRRNDLLLMGIADHLPKNPPENSIFEYSVSVANAFQEICNILQYNKGIFTTFDYGYFEPSLKDTLQSLYKHKFNPIFENIGQADITAYVDFGLLKRVADNNGLKSYFMSTQREFLEYYGISVRAEKLETGKSEGQKQQIQAGLARLTDAHQMGDIFKTFSILKV